MQQLNQCPVRIFANGDIGEPGMASLWFREKLDTFGFETLYVAREVVGSIVMARVGRVVCVVGFVLGVVAGALMGG